MARTYKDAIKELNTLQSNSSDRDESRQKDETYQNNKLEKAKKFAERAKVKIEDLDNLAAIHVSGTKGKGSVCAFSERILRENGRKTGFYSSPHLVEVRERIRINGKPISKEKFAHYFWECWHNLKQKVDDDMPSYFVFLTIMSFYVFIQEKVDVAIIEVGIGGTFDTTNIIRRPWVCGVTSLGRDHVELLGGTTESIASNKAGIFKDGVPAFTVPQDDISEQVLLLRAKELKIPLKVVPELCDYQGGTAVTLGIEGKHQFQNASLALQLCSTWLERKETEEKNLAEGTENINNSMETRNDLIPSADTSIIDKNFKKEEKNLSEGTENINNSMETNDRIPPAGTFKIEENFKNALENTCWPGRTQCIKRESYTLYLDGAHTPKSSDACSTWFRKKADEEKQSLSEQSVARVLIFNCTGKRVPSELLEPLVSCDFDLAVFCTNFVTEESGEKSSDLHYLNLSEDSILIRRNENYEAWKQLTGKTGLVPSSDLDRRSNTKHSLCVFSLSEALHWVLMKPEPSPNGSEDQHLPHLRFHSDHVQVLVVGSLHLVGAAMKVLKINIENV